MTTTPCKHCGSQLWPAGYGCPLCPRTLKPPRKPVTAWEIEDEFDEDGRFHVLTFHHGLGEMTRLDLSIDDLRDLAEYARQEARSEP